MRAKDKKVISARIHPKLYEKLDRFIQKHNRKGKSKITRQDVIEKSLERYLE